MWSRAEMRHRRKVRDLSSSCSPDADAEETLVEVQLHLRVGALDVVHGDRRTAGDVPDMLAVLLQEVRIRLGMLEDPGDRCRLVGGSLGDRRQLQSVARCPLLKSVDGGESKQTL